MHPHRFGMMIIVGRLKDTVGVATVLLRQAAAVLSCGSSPCPAYAPHQRVPNQVRSQAALVLLDKCRAFLSSWRPGR